MPVLRSGTRTSVRQEPYPVPAWIGSDAQYKTSDAFLVDQLKHAKPRDLGTEDRITRTPRRVNYGTGSVMNRSHDARCLMVGRAVWRLVAREHNSTCYRAAEVADTAVELICDGINTDVLTALNPPELAISPTSPQSPMPRASFKALGISRRTDKDSGYEGSDEGSEKDRAHITKDLCNHLDFASMGIDLNEEQYGKAQQPMAGQTASSAEVDAEDDTDDPEVWRCRRKWFDVYEVMCKAKQNGHTGDNTKTAKTSTAAASEETQSSRQETSEARNNSAVAEVDGEKSTGQQLEQESLSDIDDAELDREMEYGHEPIDFDTLDAATLRALLNPESIDRDQAMETTEVEETADMDEEALGDLDDADLDAEMEYEHDDIDYDSFNAATLGVDLGSEFNHSSEAQAFVNGGLRGTNSEAADLVAEAYDDEEMSEDED